MIRGKQALFKDRGREATQNGYRTCCTSQTSSNVPLLCFYLFFQFPIPCSVVGPVALAAHLTRPSLPRWSLFEKALVEEMGAAGESLVLQTEEQVPEVDTCDALPRGPGARRPAGERRARRWSLPVPDQQEGSGHRRGERGSVCFFKNCSTKRYVTLKVYAGPNTIEFWGLLMFYMNELCPTSAPEEEDGESRNLLFFLGPMAARAVRLASLCLSWASSCCCI